MIRSGLGTGRMNKADAQGTAGRLSAIVANSLDTQAETQDLARLANQSRTQFHRLFRTVKKLREPCDDGYCWKEPHINWRTREYRSRRSPWTQTTVRWRRSLALSEKLFRTSPSLYRRMRDPYFHLPASNKIHFLAPGSSTKGGREMDLFDRFAGNDSWRTRRLLEYAGTLTEEQLDQPLPLVVELLPWRESNKTLRQLLENIIFTKEVWTAALSGADMDMNGPPKSQRSPQAMLQRLEKTDAELHRILSDVRNRSAWDDTFVDALCEPAETFT